MTTPGMNPRSLAPKNVTNQGSFEKVSTCRKREP
jgi:hypothetical protein